MKAEVVATSAELLVPDLIQACREGITAAGTANRGDFLLALLAAMVQQDSNMQGGPLGEKQGEAFPALESMLPGQGGSKDGQVSDGSVKDCWQYLQALQGSSLCVPLPLQLPAETGTSPEQAPLAVMNLNANSIKGFSQAQAVPPGETAGTAAAPEQAPPAAMNLNANLNSMKGLDQMQAMLTGEGEKRGTAAAPELPESVGMAAGDVTGRQNLNSTPVAADGNQAQFQPGFSADRISMALRSAGSGKSSGEEQAVRETLSGARLSVSQSGSRNGWGIQDAIAAELRENGVQLKMVDRIPAAGEVQYPIGVEQADEGLSGVSVNVTEGQIPVQAGKAYLPTDQERNQGNGSGPVAGDTGSDEDQLSRELRDIGRSSGGDGDSGKKDAQGAEGSLDVKTIRKAVPGDTGETAEIDPSVSSSENQRAAVSRGETLHLADKGSQYDPKSSFTTQLANVSPGKFPEVVMPHVAAMLRNAAPDRAGVTVIRLKLEPENMGEIKIRLAYSKGELTAHFYTSSGLVKDAVECSLPQLRETLAQHNISLGEAGAFVGQEQQGQKGTGFTGFGYGRQDRLNGGFSGEYSGEPAKPVYSGNNGGSLDLLI